MIFWTAVAAVGTVAAAIGTVGALFVIYQQLKQSRREAADQRRQYEESREMAMTPLLSLILGSTSSEGPQARQDVALKIDGTGIAYAVELRFFTDDERDLVRFQFQPTRVSLGTQRPSDQPIHQVFAWMPKEGQRPHGTFEVSFINGLNHRIVWTQPVWLAGSLTHDGSPSTRSLGEHR